MCGSRFLCEASTPPSLTISVHVSTFCAQMFDNCQMLDALWDFTQIPTMPQAPSLRTGETTRVRVRDWGEEAGFGLGLFTCLMGCCSLGGCC